jgi:hypothetical protein
MQRKLKSRGPDNRSVDIEDVYALDFWAREFNVSKEKVKAAVLSAGNSAPDVRRELTKKV